MPLDAKFSQITLTTDPVFRSPAFRQCLTLFGAGRLEEAGILCDTILQSNQGNLPLIHLRGSICARGEKFEEAVHWFATAAKAPAVPAPILFDLALAQAKRGRWAEAVAAYDNGLALVPEHPESWHNRGVALAALGHFNAAVSSYSRALAVRPHYRQALLDCGDALHAIGRHEEALDTCDRVLALDPVDVTALDKRSLALAQLDRDAEALDSYNRALTLQPGLVGALIGGGNALTRLRRYGEAVECFDQALRHDPVSAEAHFFRGEALKADERYQEAVAAYDKALALRPASPEGWNHRGAALNELKQMADALESCDRALRLRPDYAAAHRNRGIALRMMGRGDEALAAADRALAIKPDDVSTLSTRGNVLRLLGRLDEAVATYDCALAIDPAVAEPAFNRATCLLLAGDYARGWPAYESRWDTTPLIRLKERLHHPIWLGDEDITGRTLLLQSEQGFGDTIQFCRYAPLIAARGATVLLRVQPQLRPLLSSLPGPQTLVDEMPSRRGADFVCPLMSLPLVCGTRVQTIPADIPYLTAPADRVEFWRDRLGDRPGPHIGFACSGNPEHRGDHERSIPLELLEPLAGLGVPLHCVQRDLRGSDVPALATMRNIRFYGQELDFVEIAALMTALDLVICVDTAAAHLAGALGRPVWVLLPYAPDWRWMLGRDDSPWYPSARLFRQPRPGDWPTVIRKVRREALRICE